MTEAMLNLTQERFDIRAVSDDGEYYSIRDNKGYWVSQDGTKRYPSQFKFSHLVNTIKLIERRAYDHYVMPEDFKIYNLLKMEYSLRLKNVEKLD